MSIPFVVQCKCYEYRKIGPEVIQQLEGVLSQKSRNTIGILVIPNKDNYTNMVKYRVKKSIYNLLLTDRDNIIIDLLKFVNNILENREELLINEIDLLENMIELKNIVDIVDNRIDNRVDIRFFYLFVILFLLQL